MPFSEPDIALVLGPLHDARLALLAVAVAGACAWLLAMARRLGSSGSSADHHDNSVSHVVKVHHPDPGDPAQVSLHEGDGVLVHRLAVHAPDTEDSDAFAQQHYRFEQQHGQWVLSHPARRVLDRAPTPGLSGTTMLRGGQPLSTTTLLDRKVTAFSRKGVTRTLIAFVTGTSVRHQPLRPLDQP